MCEVRSHEHEDRPTEEVRHLDSAANSDTQRITDECDRRKDTQAATEQRQIEDK